MYELHIYIAKKNARKQKCQLSKKIPKTFYQLFSVSLIVVLETWFLRMFSVAVNFSLRLLFFASLFTFKSFSRSLLLLQFLLSAGSSSSLKEFCLIQFTKLFRLSSMFCFPEPHPFPE